MVNSGRNCSSKRLCLAARKISVKIRITGLASARSAAARIQVSRHRGPPTDSRAELAGSHTSRVLTSGKTCPAVRGNTDLLVVLVRPKLGLGLTRSIRLNKTVVAACVVVLRALCGV